jgi:hypothetical protein
MRTKTLLLTAALGAAGIATSMAQVYLVNAVGYVNKSIAKKAGAALTYAMLANPLNGTNNVIGTVMPTPPDGTLLFKFTGGAFEAPETYIDGIGWDPGTAVLSPGEGFFVALDNAVAPDPTVITFVGEVPQGTLVNNVPAGYSIKSSIVPQTGAVSTDLGMVAPDGTLIFTWNVVNQSYDAPYTYIDGIGWDPADPVIPVAEGFFILNGGATAFDWTRDFSVN